jgi:DNA-binding NarL/FixJ family response regulator
VNDDTIDRKKIRVVLAEDDPFALSLVSDGLRALGYDVTTALTAEEAGVLVENEDPHVLVTDLNFGSGETGASLLARVRENHPWVALVVLTSHQSPALAVDNPELIPDHVVYLVKSAVRSTDDLGAAVQRALAGATEVRTDDDDTETLIVSAGQAEVLRMLATGASMRAIADHRGTTVRAAESMMTRLYASLDLADDALTNPRIVAVNLWNQGKIAVK